MALVDGTTTYNNVTVANSPLAILTTGNGITNAGGTPSSRLIR